MFEELRTEQEALARHRLYALLDSPAAIRTFMEHHVYAVWDFMTLLKALQRRLTCVELPWRPNPGSSEAVRFINEIVLGEESDLDAAGRPNSHYAMYLDAMKEVGANTEPVKRFVRSLDMAALPKAVHPFVAYNLRLAERGTDEEVAAAFLFGREKPIPEMFSRIVSALGDEAGNCPALIYYLERHIELDGDEHGPVAEQLLERLVDGDATRRQWALEAGHKALTLRHQLWDRVAERITGNKRRIQAARETA